MSGRWSARCLRPPISLIAFRSASRRDRSKHRDLPTLPGGMEPIFTSSCTQSIGVATRKRDTVLTTVAVLMIIFGIVKVTAGFHHALFSIHPAHIPIASFLGAGMGVLYFFAGTLTLTAKKSAAALALCLLAVIILSHVASVITDLYPTDSVSQLFEIVLGTSIACAFLVVLALKWETFA
jgi:hypothetical protein